MNKTYTSIFELNQNIVFNHFFKICKVPRPSFHEEKISEYLFNWAKEKNLEVEKDVHKNILIRKPASKGYEKAPGVILQAHMDMVCEKEPGIIHDFMNDAIIPVLEGDFITTGGKTTLGSDNGIGMALALMAMDMDSEIFPHPSLEALFTTAEEEDLSGAICFDSKCLKGKYLINLDHAADYEFLSGSCGGVGVEINIPIKFVNTKDETLYYNIFVNKMPGGHSGEDIDKGHGNANQILARLIYNLNKKTNCSVCNLSGGSFRLSIARDAKALLAVPADNEKNLIECIKELSEAIKKEYEVTAPMLEITYEKVSKNNSYLDTESMNKLIQALYLCPDGINAMNGAIHGIVESSDNMGEIRIEKDALILICEIRTAYNSTKDYLVEKMKILSEMLGGTCKTFSEYPSWTFVPNSPFRHIAEHVYEKEFKEKPIVTIVHAGLECGCFFQKNQSLDAISIGPNQWNFHSPSEKVSISSVEKIEKFLKALLKEIK